MIPNTDVFTIQQRNYEWARDLHFFLEIRATSFQESFTCPKFGIGQ